MCPPAPYNVVDIEITSYLQTSGYASAYQHLHVEETDVIFPIQMFIDKTHLNDLGQLHLEPVIFTFTLFNQETKNWACAWHPLGYVNDLDVMSSAQKSSKKQGSSAIDYHRIMGIVLQSLVLSQVKGRFTFQFPFGGEGILNLKFPVAFVIGDIKGQNALRGMYIMGLVVKEFTGPVTVPLRTVTTQMSSATG